MSNQIGIARPYAKALFEYALSQDQLTAWSAWLATASEIVVNDAFQALLKNPSVEITRVVDILMAALSKMSNQVPKGQDAFLQILAENRRLSAVPEISAQFDALKAQQEKTMKVIVRTVTSLANTQVERLVAALSQRFGRKVSIEEQIDPSLIGGAIIQANHLVIDGSVKGQLLKLAAELAA